jgi:prophage regulatory protein
MKIMRLPEVKAMVGLGTTAIYALIKKGEFPKPVKIGRASRWVEQEIQEWIMERVRARSNDSVGARL